LARATSQGTALLNAITQRVVLLARWGNPGEAWTLANEVGELANETGMRRGEPWFRSELALLEMSRGDPGAADRVMIGQVPWASRDFLLPALELPIRAEALIGL